MPILDSISASLDVLNKSADFIKKIQEIQMNFTLPNEVKKINDKLDQDIIRKIKSGYESIGFALRRSADGTSRAEDLEDARRNLGDCINLSEKLDTGGIPNGEVMAVAHYGLATIYSLKSQKNEDRERAAIHLLKAFHTGPRKTRELVPDIYNQLFKSSCGDLVMPITRYSAMTAAEKIVAESMNPQTKSNDELIRGATEIGKGLLQGAVFLGGVALAVVSLGRIPPSVFVAGAGDINKGINKVDPDHIVNQKRAQKISQESENIMKNNEYLMRRQDDCTKNKAIEYLLKLDIR